MGTPQIITKGLSFDLCDTREVLPNQDAICSEFSTSKIFNGELDAQLLAEYQELIVSPGIAIAEPAIAYAIKQGSRVRGDVDIFAEYVTKPIIGITGSNGKSTVTTLVGEILAFLFWMFCCMTMIIIVTSLNYPASS